MQLIGRLSAAIASALPILALACFGIVTTLGPGSLSTPAMAQEDAQNQSQPEPPAQAQGPANALGDSSDADLWRAIRQGEQGYVSIPNGRAGVLIQSEGENWRSIRNGPLSTYGVWAMLGIIALLALFFAFRGRIRLEHGRSGDLVERFNGLERFAHWLTAVSFIVLALTGLNMLYGRYVLRPLVGPEIFSAVTQAGKYAHDYVAFAFMAGLALIFVLWIRDNIPDRVDAKWIAKGGGFFKKGSHPPARRFNAGQKLIFWLVVLGGISVSLSGIALLFPFEFSMFSKTFAAINLLGFDLPTNLTALDEMQLSHLWHGIIGLLLIAVIIAHIYIGTIGMEGAFDAMGSGMVDANWAEEHHRLWVEEMRRKPSAADRSTAIRAGGD